MYNENSNAAYTTPDQASKSSLLNGISNQLFALINEQEATLNRIESKLHDILNKRQATSLTNGMPPQAEIPMMDMANKLQKENNRFGRLQQHPYKN